MTENELKTAASQVIRDYEYENPTDISITNADSIIESIDNYFGPELEDGQAPDYRYWVNNTLHEVFFTYESVDYVAWKEELSDSDGWNITTQADMNRVQNYND